MKNIYLISKFIGVSHGFNKFDFTGYFGGIRIKKILVKGGSFEKNEDYVLLLEEMTNLESTLYSKLIKSKKIF
jgi:hypothetical protein